MLVTPIQPSSPERRRRCQPSRRAELRRLAVRAVQRAAGPPARPDQQRTEQAAGYGLPGQRRLRPRARARLRRRLHAGRDRQRQPGLCAVRLDHHDLYRQHPLCRRPARHADAKRHLFGISPIPTGRSHRRSTAARASTSIGPARVPPRDRPALSANLGVSYIDVEPKKSLLGINTLGYKGPGFDISATYHRAPG